MERIVHNLVPNSPEWHAFRLEHDGASECAAMLGLSKKTGRNELLRMKHTGLPKEFGEWLQANVLDKGHEIEALARPFAVEFAGVDGFYPATVSIGRTSASCDGIDMLDETAWECKSLNKDNLPIVLAGRVPEEHMPQCQQVLMVTGADRLLFTVTDGTRENTHHVWVDPDTDWFDRIRAGWKQFHEDLAAYVPPEPPAAKIVAEPVEALPAPVIQVTGQLALQDNFKVFEDRLRDFLANRLIREPKTDEDFVNLDAQIKAMKAGREALKSAKAQMLAQVQPVDQAGKTADMLDSLLQQNCKLAEDLLKNEKERRRGEIVTAGMKAFADHVLALNNRIGHPYMPAIPVDFGGCVKGLKSLSSMEEKVATHLANAKIAANDVADRIQINLTTMRELAADHATLFPDTVQLVLKGNDDLTALVKTRIAEHLAAEQRRADALAEQARERIAAEERAKAEAKVREDQAAEDALIAGIWEQARRIEGNRVGYVQKAMAYFEQGPGHYANDSRPRVAAAVTAARAEMAEKLKVAQAREDADRADQETRDAIAKDAVPVTQPAPVPTPVIVAQAPAPAAPDATRPPPSLSLGKISERLGFTVSADFLRSIGFEPGARVKAAMLYHESDFPRICRALVRHIESVAEVVTA